MSLPAAILPAPSSSPAAAPAGPAARVAVLIRTRELGDAARHLLTALRAGIGYDVFACIEAAGGSAPAEDLPAGDLPAADVPDAAGALRYDAAAVAGLGLSGSLPEADYPGTDLFWFFGDYAWYVAGTRLPDYDHYLIVDERLGLRRGNPLFVEALARRLAGDAQGPFDLVTSWLDLRSDAWLWHGDTAAVFGQVHGMFAPFVALSRRAVAHLFAWRQREAASGARPLFWEALVPTALIAAGGFRCADVGALLPGCWNADSFPAMAPMLLGALPALPQAVEMVYPVLPERDYLTWLLEQCRAAGTLADLVGRLAPGGDLDVSPPARAWFLQAALRAMAANSDASNAPGHQ